LLYYCRFLWMPQQVGKCIRWGSWSMWMMNHGYPLHAFFMWRGYEHSHIHSLLMFAYVFVLQMGRSNGDDRVGQIGEGLGGSALDSLFVMQVCAGNEFSLALTGVFHLFYSTPLYSSGNSFMAYDTWYSND
jgi:hypothetical protein